MLNLNQQKVWLLVGIIFFSTFSQKQFYNVPNLEKEIYKISNRFNIYIIYKKNVNEKKYLNIT